MDNFIEESERFEALANGVFTSRSRSKPKAKLNPVKLKKLKAKLNQG